MTLPDFTDMETPAVANLAITRRTWADALVAMHHHYDIPVPEEPNATIWKEIEVVQAELAVRHVDLINRLARQ